MPLPMVLLVEDEPSVRRITRRLLQTGGFVVVEAADGQEGLRVARETMGIDVVLSDVVMPRLSGPAMAAQLMRERPELPIVFMSGYVDDAFERGLGGQAHPVLHKPFSRDELIGRLEVALSERAPPSPSG